jgi:hypothetical protein
MEKSSPLLSKEYLNKCPTTLHPHPYQNIGRDTPPPQYHTILAGQGKNIILKG